MSSLKRTLLAALTLALVAGLAGAASAPVRALDRQMSQQIMKAAVQLGPLFLVEDEDGTYLRAIGWGSGTIISPSGLILTNYHVADTSELATDLPRNVQLVEDALCVYVSTRSDEPPTPSFIAEPVMLSEELDLAVLQITMDTDGEEINWRQTRLPYCELGDSDQLEVLDNLFIFGYPGIGGDTVTVTQGVVGGFTAEAGLGKRAWIKTSTGIAGGNSGGTAVDDDGKLVGVPTQGGSGGAQDQIVDCRPVADTNGDGRLNEKDTCVPMGMFINALRPINLATPLIEQALRRSTPGKDDPGLNPKPDPTPTAAEGVMVIGTIIDADTRRPIPGALFLALKPGVTYDDFESDDQVYTAAEADRNGEFVLPNLLQRGKSYTLVSGLKGYQPVWEDGVYVGKDANPVVDLTIRLKRR